MTKVYPNAPIIPPPQLTGNPTAVHVNLTVWKKSLLFNCDGFTVFDSNGNLIFRVDNYIRRKGIVLMDASGSSLLTILCRHKRLGLTEKWLVYDGETCVHPRFSARKHVLHHVMLNFLNTSRSSNSPRLAHVMTGELQGTLLYEIEGSYTERCCTVYDGKRRRVVEIRRKEAASGLGGGGGGGGVLLGTDVFRLTILEPAEMDSTVAMALVLLLDQMFST